MANFVVDEDTMKEIFESKENVKKSVLAVMDNRLTAAHLASDVFMLIELLDKLEVLLIGEPLVQQIPEQQPAQEQPPQEQPSQEQLAQEQPAQEQTQPAQTEQPQ